MQFFKNFKNKYTFTALSFLMVSASMAQSTASTLPANDSFNQLAILLLILIFVLAFVIWGMGQVLAALGKQLLDKSKTNSKLLSAILLLGFSLAQQSIFAQEAAVTKIVKPLPNYGGLSEATFYAFLTVIITELVIIFFLAFSIRRMYTELLPQKVKSKTNTSQFSVWWKKMDQKLFTKAVAIEKETDILLDHDYDGIRELDNSLPPWWKYGFYITIAVGFIYLINFHVLGTGLNPTEEYNAAMNKARIEKEIFEANNKDRIDENNIAMADAAGIKAGQALYDANCVACHLKDGGGIVGPNLTDDYWIHKGSLNDIYKTIKVGYPDKGMQPWASNFSPKEISFIASFIKSLKGTKPATPKEPQGEIYVDDHSGASDSLTVTMPDTTNIKM